MKSETIIAKGEGLAALMPLLNRLNCHVRHKMSKVYAKLGYALTPETADALMIIHHFDGLPQKKLADILGKDKASITRLLNSLVKSHLVERIQDQQDRRVIRAHITPEGQHAFVQIHPAIQVMNDDILKDVSEADFNHMMQTFSTIIGSLNCPNQDDTAA